MNYPENWQEENNFLTRIFKFNNFVEAIDFVNKIVPLAEEANHHPDIDIFGYNQVKIKLTSHDAGNKITDKDVKLASKINECLTFTKE